MAAVTAAVVGAVVAVAGTAYSISESERAKGEAKKKTREQKAHMSKLEQEAEEKTAIEEANKNRDQQRARQKLMQSGKTGRSGTILTSPLGTPGGGAGSGSVGGAPAGAAGKTILGV